MNIKLIQCPLNRYTFKVKNIRDWVVSQCVGKTLNLFCGITKLTIDEVRNDLDPTVEADYHMDALDCIKQWLEPIFCTIILDPPYSYRKSVEMYGDRKASSFMMVKEYIPVVLNKGGRVITFGYQSVSMGKVRGFHVDNICIFSHGGAIHDTIATVEIYDGPKETMIQGELWPEMKDKENEQT